MSDSVKNQRVDEMHGVERKVPAYPLTSQLPIPNLYTPKPSRLIWPSPNERQVMCSPYARIPPEKVVTIASSRPLARGEIRASRTPSCFVVSPPSKAPCTCPDRLGRARSRDKDFMRAGRCASYMDRPVVAWGSGRGEGRSPMPIGSVEG